MNINEPVMVVHFGSLYRGKITQLDPNVVVTLDSPYHISCVDVVLSVHFGADGKALNGFHRFYERKGWEQLINHRLEVIESAGVLTDPTEDESEELYFKAHKRTH